MFVPMLVMVLVVGAAAWVSPIVRSFHWVVLGGTVLSGTGFLQTLVRGGGYGQMLTALMSSPP